MITVSFWEWIVELHVCLLHLITGPFLYSGWEYQGADVDEEEEDLEADAAAAEEEEEEGGEEVSPRGDNPLCYSFVWLINTIS